MSDIAANGRRKKAPIVVIGASAGGVEALQALVRSLRHNLNATLFVVLHIPSGTASHLPRILEAAGPLKALHPTDGQLFQPGCIYVAPPGHHLMLTADRIDLTRGPRENRQRPAIDPLFRSAARSHGEAVIGVILTGTGSDGAVGLAAIKARGGIAVVQAPADAVYPQMPTKAMEVAPVDFVVPVKEIGSLLNRLVEERTIPPGAVAMDSGQDNAESRDLRHREAEVHASRPSAYSCPECGGVLWEIEDNEILRYRCRVGHAYTADSLLADQSEALEVALWASLRALEERAALLKQMAERQEERGFSLSARQFRANGREMEEHAATLRDLLDENQLFETGGGAEHDEGVSPAESV